MKEFQFESYGILYCSAEVYDQEANRSTAHIFYAYLATYLFKLTQIRRTNKHACYWILKISNQMSNSVWSA